MFITSIGALLKNWKGVGFGLILLLTVGLAGTSYYLYSNNQDLKIENYQKSQDILTLQSANERQRQQFETETSALESSLQNYQSSLETAKKSNNLLKSKLENEGETNEIIKQCLTQPLSDDVINSLR